MKQKINFISFISLIFFNNFFAMDIRLLLNSQPTEAKSDQNKIVFQLNNLQPKKIIQPKQNKKIFCSDCNKYFSYIYFYQHRKIHTQKGLRSCKYCTKKFVNKSQLIKHTRVHTNEKPFDCDQCHKKFMYSSSLYSHKKIHEGKKNFHCEPCSTSFLLKQQLKYHEKSQKHRTNLNNFVKNSLNNSLSNLRNIA